MASLLSVESYKYVAVIYNNPRISVLASLLLLIVWLGLESIKEAFRLDLRSIPGPRWARFSRLYRVAKVWDGQSPLFYIKLHEDFGPIVRTGPNTVSISDPRAVAQIHGVSSEFMKSNIYDLFTATYKGKPMPSLLSTRDPVMHRHLKRPIASKYSMTSIKTFEPLVDQCEDIFFRAMRKHEGETIDLGEWLHWYAFDVISTMTFSRQFGFMEREKDVHEMIAGISFALKYGAVVGQIPVLHNWLNPFLLWVATIPFLNVPNPLKTVVEFAEECVNMYDSTEKGRDQRADFLSWLRQEEIKNKERLSEQDLMNHLSSNLLGGSDTTRIAMCAILYYVIHDSHVYNRLQREIDDADCAGKLSEHVTYAESLELEYLQVVMKEAMRCHPSLAFPLERVVPEGGATICGTKLRGGTIVGINPIVQHHNKEIFGADASEFRPERWFDSDSEQIQLMNRSLLTFGHGSRSCIGKNISIMEMGKLVPQIMRHFDLFWASNKPTWKVNTYWFAMQTGIFVKMRSRAKN